MNIYECQNCDTIFISKRAIANPCPICNFPQLIEFERS